MNADKSSEHSHPYDNWKAVTEADFVTLFIKTWFAFVSTLRELYPQSKPYYEASGDSSFVEAYKKDFAERFYFLCPLTVGVEQSLHSTYKAGLRIISEKYPRFLAQDFYNHNLSYSDKYEEDYDSTGGYSGKLSLSVKCASSSQVKVSLRSSDEKFQKKADEKPVLAEMKIDYSAILERFIEGLEQTPHSVGENELPSFFCENLFQIIFNELTDVLSKKQKVLPDKGFQQVKQVYMVIQSFCRRAVDAMRISCMDPTISAEHKLLSQTPIADFLESYGELSSMDKKNAYLWFVGFVYRLRNALFHEIIDPLNPEWQHVFKNAYLVLKQVVDANISSLKTVAQLLKLAPLEYWKDFTDDPPPQIPIKPNDGTVFTYDDVALKYYNETGASVHIVSNITCEGNTYRVECDVKWDEKLQEHKTKNVQIVML